MPNEGGADVFVHASTLQAMDFLTLKEQQRVSVDVAQGPKGPPQAASVSEPCPSEAGGSRY